MEPVVLKVEGMSCQHCVSSVTKALTGLAGVEKAEVDLKAKTAKVWGGPAKDEMIAAIEKIGFSAS